MIKLYYHIYTSTHKMLGMSFVDQQLRRLYVSDIHRYAELNCLITGPYHNEVEELVTRYSKDWRIIESRPDDPEGLREARTLHYLHKETQAEDLVMFLHTKGISYHSGQNRLHGFTLPRNLRAINSWRFALEYICLDEWRSRVHRLTTQPIDTESAFMNLEPYWNYCGNIWWSKGSHIRRLPDPLTVEGVDYKNLSRSWLFYFKGNHTSIFHVLDKPREDGRGGYGTFRLHEDDLMKYLIEHRDSAAMQNITQLTPESMQILEQYFIQRTNK